MKKNGEFAAEKIEPLSNPLLTLSDQSTAASEVVATHARATVEEIDKQSLLSPGAHIDKLARALAELIGQRPVALFDWPCYANAGDHFIWLGEKVLLKNRVTAILFTNALCSRLAFSS